MKVCFDRKQLYEENVSLKRPWQAFDSYSPVPFYYEMK